MLNLDVSGERSGARDDDSKLVTADLKRRPRAGAKKKARKQPFGNSSPVRRLRDYQKKVVPIAKASSWIVVLIWFSLVV
jgi:hypothetical protein